MEKRLSCKGVFVSASTFQLSRAHKRPLKNKHLNPCFYNWSQIPVEREAEDKIRRRNDLTAWTALTLEIASFMQALAKGFGISMIHPDELTDRAGTSKQRGAVFLWHAKDSRENVRNTTVNSD